MSVIKVDHLIKDYGNNKGVFDVSFEVESGETFGFLGPNGAGKTTTIRHILGFSKPQKGSTWVSDLGKAGGDTERPWLPAGRNRIPGGYDRHGLVQNDG
jgi:ABC-type multidrug transport system ATPase subunit